MPAVEIVLSIDEFCMDGNPGVEKASPLIRPILYGKNSMKIKSDEDAYSKLCLKRNLNHEYMMVPEADPMFSQTATFREPEPTHFRFDDSKHLAQVNPLLQDLTRNSQMSTHSTRPKRYNDDQNDFALPARPYTAKGYQINKRYNDVVPSTYEKYQYVKTPREQRYVPGFSNPCTSNASTASSLQVTPTSQASED